MENMAVCIGEINISPDTIYLVVMSHGATIHKFQHAVEARLFAGEHASKFKLGIVPFNRRGELISILCFPIEFFDKIKNIAAEFGGECINKWPNEFNEERTKHIYGNLPRSEVFVYKETGVCNQCGKFPCLKRCSGCQMVYYCDKNCQKKDWKTHKPHCYKISE